MYLYRLGGLGLCSDMELPLPPGTGEPAFEICQGVPPLALAPESKRHPNLWFTQNEMLLHRPGHFRMYVANGNRITYALESEGDRDWLRLFILGSGLGQLLIQNGYVLLHGNASLFRDGAVIFSGPKGAGKSTISATLDLLGRDLLADDMSPVRVNQAGIMELLPAVPRIKLLPEAIKGLGLDIAKHPLLMQNYTKHAYLGINPPPARHLPLGLIVLLERGPETKLELLKGASSLLALEQNLCFPRRAWHQGRKPEEFTMLGQIARSVPIARLTRPFELSQIKDVTCQVIDKIELLLDQIETSA